MLDLNNGTSLTNDQLSTATDNLIQSKEKLEAIVSMLRRAVGLTLEEGALMGFCGILDDVKQDIQDMLDVVESCDDECDCYDEEAPKNWAQYNELNNIYRKTYAENLKLKKELADMKAIKEIEHVADNASRKVLRENKEKTVGEVMWVADAAFNRAMTEGFKKAGIKTEDDAIKDLQQRAIDRAMAVAEAISEAKAAAKPAPCYEDIPLGGNDR